MAVSEKKGKEVAFLNTFAHGIHPPGNKEITQDIPTSKLPEPEIVYIPLSQHLGKPAVPIVAKGDRVKVGQKIGEADGKISAHVFSSVSGEVTGIERRVTATGHCDHIVIHSDGQFDEVRFAPLSNPTPEQIVKRIEDAAIVGQGGAGFPTAVKLSPRDKIDTFIVNGAECEPYLTCDNRIMTENVAQFLEGARCMAVALGLSEFFVGIEDNKPQAAEIVQNAINSAQINAKIILCHTKYPQGAEKQLIFSATKRKVRVGKLPSSVGVIVSNVQTALSVYYAVKEGMPSYMRLLTVSGRGAYKPGNYWVRTGTKISDVLGFLGGASDDTVKMILGGPMMGFAQSDGESAVGKTTGGILLLTESEVAQFTPETCINCAACARACPMHLMPMYIDSYILSGDTKGAEKYGAMNCIECGSCSYVCPAHRPLVQSIRLAKKKIRARGSAK